MGDRASTGQRSLPLPGASLQSKVSGPWMRRRFESDENGRRGSSITPAEIQPLEQYIGGEGEEGMQAGHQVTLCIRSVRPGAASRSAVRVARKEALDDRWELRDLRFFFIT